MAHLNELRGEACRYKHADLRRRIYATTLKDLSSTLWKVLDQHGGSMKEFELLREQRWCEFLDSMQTCRADMHLRNQWAKNADLKPKESDLIDWVYLGIAVSYCDLVVTEKQMADFVAARLTSQLVEVG